MPCQSRKSKYSGRQLTGHERDFTDLQLKLVLEQGKRLPGCHAQLPLDQVQPCHCLCHRVLHLHRCFLKPVPSCNLRSQSLCKARGTHLV